MSDEAKRQTTYYAGLDLGPAGEFTGLAVLEKHYTLGKFGDQSDTGYAVRHLARFPPGTPYSQVLETVRTVFAEPPVKGGVLVVDQTGVGRAIFEGFLRGKLGASVYGVTVTAGHAAAPDERGGWLVPKKDLVGVLQLLLQEKRIKVAPALEHAHTLAEELQHFQLKTISLDPSAVEWRERPHDDLVLAVAVAAWQAERSGPAFYLFSASEEPEPRSRWLSRW